ncbi:MAG: hypothetical protein BWK80_38435, partial [Desulfobacteraceae bacterium IS3]
SYAEFQNIYLCGTLRLKKNEPQSYAKFPQSYAEFQNIYLCGTLRFTLRNSAVKKKAVFNCVTPVQI